MRGRGEESPFAALLPSDTVLSQMEMAVIVIDRFSNVIYGNEFARQLFGFGEEFIGHSVLSATTAAPSTPGRTPYRCGTRRATSTAL